MYSEDINKMCEVGEKKLYLINKNFLGYLFLSILAGMFVSFAVLLAYSVGAMTHNLDGYKLAMGFCFASALSFIYFAGGELFTGNCFTLTIASVKKKVSWANTIKILVVCYIGNFIGSAIIVGIVLLTGLMSGETGQFFADYSSIKMNLQPIQIISRAILCNILVSLATWCGYRMKSESGKLIIIFWCVLAFFATGFEHSIANMSLLLLGAINPFGTGNTFMGAFYNISLATIGNIIGASIFLAVPYLIVGKEKK